VRAAPSCIAAVLTLAAAIPFAVAEDAARQAAATFGRALVANKAASLMPILPQQGRVHVTLVRLGPEDGRFGANQVVALFRDVLATGKFESFEIVRCETDGSRSALAHAVASIVDREGRHGRIGVHLAFEPEGGRWVLREVKETVE
jgi:hypothetical protein